tara:strand:- start:288 stop:455 length:168 start_codon:yes stop_codon:yes gene_type:complete
MTTFTRSEIEELQKIEIICQRKISNIKEEGYDYETLAEITNGLNYFIGEFENDNK